MKVHKTLRTRTVQPRMGGKQEIQMGQKEPAIRLCRQKINFLFYLIFVENFYAPAHSQNNWKTLEFIAENQHRNNKNRDNISVGSNPKISRCIFAKNFYLDFLYWITLKPCIFQFLFRHWSYYFKRDTES